MEIEELKKIIKMIDKSSIMEFRYSDGDFRIAMSRSENPPQIISDGTAEAESSAIDI